jgi:hypothetical protein
MKTYTSIYETGFNWGSVQRLPQFSGISGRSVLSPFVAGCGKPDGRGASSPMTLPDGCGGKPVLSPGDTAGEAVFALGLHVPDHRSCFWGRRACPGPHDRMSRKGEEMVVLVNFFGRPCAGDDLAEYTRSSGCPSSRLSLAKSRNQQDQRISSAKDFYRNLWSFFRQI